MVDDSLIERNSLIERRTKYISDKMMNLNDHFDVFSHFEETYCSIADYKRMRHHKWRRLD